MALDLGEYNYGGEGMPEKSKLTLSGAYKHSAKGGAVVYCASGQYDGRQVGLYESSLIQALHQLDGGKANVDLWDSKPKPSDYVPETLSLTVSEIRRALGEINRVAPHDRPDPLAAVA